MKKNYFEIIEFIEGVCLQHPFVNNFYYGIYRALEADNIDYSAIILTSSGINRSQNTIEYKFNLMYVDRLMNDRSNEIEIQSTGLDVLQGILSVISESDPYTDYNLNYSLNVFREQFADNVSGCVTTISITAPSNIGECTWYVYCDPCNKSNCSK